MAFEVELKFPLQAESDWAAHGFLFAIERDEADSYFNAPDRDFAHTDEALRLRQIGLRNILTYKGPKQGTVGKTRLEIETPLADGPTAVASLVATLHALGYRPTVTVKKRRRLYHAAPGSTLPAGIELCVDEVEGVGRFVELEVQAEPADAGRAQEELLAVARRLGLGANERRSYLEMLLASRGEAK